MELEKTVERIVPTTFKTREEYLLYLRHVFAYEQYIDYLTKADQKVVEVGFGEGYGTNKIALSGRQVTALDVNKEAVEYARSTYGSPHCTFMLYDGKRIPFDDNTFDSACSFQVIEHVEDVASYLKEIKRVLKPGTSAYFTTPNRCSRLQEDEEPWNPFHLREYSPAELEQQILAVFEHARLFGVRADQEVERTEQNRVRRSPSFYKLLPAPLKRMVSGDFMNTYDTSSFYLTPKDPHKAMDLFVIATKRSE